MSLVDKCVHSGTLLVDPGRLTLRERRFLFGCLLSGNATQSYLAIVMQVGSQEEHAHQAASRMLGRIKRRLNWQALLERIDIGEMRLVRQLEAELLARGTAEGDGAAVLLAELLRARANPADSASNSAQIEPESGGSETLLQTSAIPGGSE